MEMLSSPAKMPLKTIISLIRCVLASLYQGPLVRRSIRPSVGNAFFSQRGWREMKSKVLEAGRKFKGRYKTLATENGCSFSMLFHNIRSARGPGFKLLETEIRQWGVK